MDTDVTPAHIPQTPGPTAPARTPAGSGLLRSPALWAVVAFLASRALMLATGWTAVSLAGVRVVGKGMYDHRHGVWHGAVPSRLFEPWANWDGQWFIRIASRGYHLVHSEAFFPLYPLIVRYVQYATGNYILAGTMVSWVAIALTLWLLYRMVAARFDPTIAAWTVAFLSFFPTSFYLTSVYSESLFLLFSVAAFYFAERKHWALAGLAGMLSVLTRNTGLFLVVPLALLMVEQERAKGVRAWARAILRPRTLWLLLLPLGMGIYMGYLQWKFGQPLLFADAQRHWGRKLSSPINAVGYATYIAARAVGYVARASTSLWASPLRPGSVTNRIAQRTLVPWLTLVGWAAVSLAAIRRLPLSYTAWSLVLLVYPLFFPAGKTPLLSYQRFVLAAFPLFIAAAVLTKRHNVTRFLLLGVSAVLLVWMAATFALWWWVA
jgi:hypothetical protein